MKKRDFTKVSSAGALGLSQISLFGCSNSTTIKDSLKNDIMAWTEQIRYKEEGWGRWKYSVAMKRPYALESSAFII